MEKLLVKVEEAARMMSISRSVLYELLSTRAISSKKIGKSRLVEVESIKTYIANLPNDDNLFVTTK